VLASASTLRSRIEHPIVLESPHPLAPARLVHPNFHFNITNVDPMYVPGLSGERNLGAGLHTRDVLSRWPKTSHWPLL